MKEQPILLLTGDEILNLFKGRETDIMEAVASAALIHKTGDATLPHSNFVFFPEKPRDRIIALPGYLGGDFQTAGIKWIASFPENVDKGIERASAVLILNDMENGRPKAIMESSIISARRTAASAAIAGDILRAGKPVKRLGLIGCGPINFEVLRFLQVRQPDINTLILYDLNLERAKQFASKSLIRTPDLSIEYAKSYEEVLGAGDITAFCTTAGVPYLGDISACPKDSVILHVSLRDLSPEVILNADNIVDDPDHVLKANTSLHLLEQKIGRRDFIRGTLADIIDGSQPPRVEGKIPIFSPFGMGLLDLALGELALKLAREQKMGQEIYGFFPPSWIEQPER
ncbi:MAG: 2,3-diaminopropionate biosynthesis protein SbnB [Desulfamplus sp.]|nr:2,3-diaminopropionate biosynthesis protein SbnB [Desulfamplus sp.]